MGTVTSDDINTYPIVYDVTFTWNEFVYEDITLSSGTAHFIMTTPSFGEFTYDYTGTFVVVYQGVTYDFTWDLNASMGELGLTYSGTMTINGVTYTWTAAA